MAILVSDSNTAADMRLRHLWFYLSVASKIVETVAFEAAPDVSPEEVQDLLELACNIERAAEKFGDRP